LRGVNFFFSSAAAKEFFLIRAKAQRRKGESKAVLCAFPALQPVRRGGRFISFFSSAEAEDYFFSRGSIRKNNANKPLGKQKICKSAAVDFFLRAKAQRRKEGFDLSPRNCSRNVY
jgi:hypothetical protein